MFKLAITTPISGLAEALKALNKELDTTRIEDEASAMLLNRLRTNFLAERTPDGVKWPESKAAKKRRASGGTGTLFASGTLFRSIQLTRFGSRRAIGTDVSYARRHNDGLDGMVKRQFLGVTTQDGLDYEKILLKRIQRAIG